MSRDDNIVDLLFKVLKRIKFIVICTLLLSVLVSGISVVSLDNKENYERICQTIDEIGYLRGLRTKVEALEVEGKEEISSDLSKRINYLKNEVTKSVEGYIENFRYDDHPNANNLKNLIRSTDHFVLNIFDYVIIFVKNFIVNCVYFFILSFIAVLAYVIYKPTIDENTFKNEIKFIGYYNEYLLNKEYLEFMKRFKFFDKLDILKNYCVLDVKSPQELEKALKKQAIKIVSTQDDFNNVIGDWNIDYEVVSDVSSLMNADVLFVEKANKSKTSQVNSLYKELSQNNNVIGGIIYE